MTWQTGTATDYIDLLNQLEEIATSDHISAAVISDGGTGYTEGDILTIDGGTYTHQCTLEVTEVSSGVITAIRIVTGGAYTSNPSSPNSPTGGSGSSASISLTVTATGWDTMLSAASGSEWEMILRGAGSGSDNIYVGIRTFQEVNGIDTAYNWVLAGMTGYNGSLSYGNQPGISPYNSSSASGGCYVPLTNASMDFWVSANSYRIICVAKTVVGAVTSYMSCYLGFMNPFATSTEYPYPIILVGSSGRNDALADSTIPDISGLTELIGISGRVGPGMFLKQNSSWTRAANSLLTYTPSISRSAVYDYVIYPVGETRLPTVGADDRVVEDGAVAWSDLLLTSGVPGSASLKLSRTPDSGGNLLLLVPATLIWTSTDGSDRDIVGELDSVFWVPADSVLTAEDYLTISGDVYRIFPNGNRQEEYSFMAIKEE